MNHPAAAGNANSAPAYQIHLDGVRPGHDAAVVALALAPAFKRSAEQLLAILNGPMIVLKRGLDRPTAEHYVARLTQAGCACSMHLQATPAPRPLRLAKAAPALPAAEQPILPSGPIGEPEPDLGMAVIGQKLSIDVIVIGFFFFKIPQQITLLGYLLCFIVMSLLAVLGVMRIVKGLRFSLRMRILNIVAAMIPVVGVIFLIVLSMKVTRRVRKAGYKVGLFGVSAADRAAIRDATPGQPHYSRGPSLLALVALVMIWGATRLLPPQVQSADEIPAGNGRAVAAEQAPRPPQR